MAFDISRDQQKLFIEHFMKQVLDVSLDLVQKGKGEGSPGETIHKVGRAVIAQLYGMGAGSDGAGDAGALMPNGKGVGGPGQTVEQKQDLLRKYALGLEEIWKRLVDQGPETGDPLALFDHAVELTEKSLASLLKD